MPVAHDSICKDRYDHHGGYDQVQKLRTDPRPSAGIVGILIPRHILFFPVIVFPVFLFLIVPHGTKRKQFYEILKPLLHISVPVICLLSVTVPLFRQAL